MTSPRPALSRSRSKLSTSPSPRRSPRCTIAWRTGRSTCCSSTPASPTSPRARWPQTSTEEFIRVMVTNALSPLRVIEALQDRVEPAGTIGVMSSGQGSVANNERGGHEVYRGSKAALNTFMRSYAARHRGERRALVLMAPGWVRTELGGPDARLSIDESIPNVVGTLDALHGRTRTAIRRLPRPNGSVVSAAGTPGRSADPGQQAWALMHGSPSSITSMASSPKRSVSAWAAGGENPLPAPRRTGDPWPARGGQRHRRPLRHPDRRPAGSPWPRRTRRTPMTTPQAGHAHGRRAPRHRDRRRHPAAPAPGDQQAPSRRPRAAHRAPHASPRGRHGRTRRSKVLPVRSLGKKFPSIPRDGPRMFARPLPRAAEIRH